MGMKKEYILAGGTIMLWGMMPPFTKLLLSGLSNAKTVFISSMIAFIFMAVLNLACGNLKRFLQFRPKDYVKMIALGFMGKFLYSVLYFYGLSGLAAGDACIINYLWPVMTAVSYTHLDVYKRQRLSRREDRLSLFAGSLFTPVREARRHRKKDLLKSFWMHPTIQVQP